MKVVPVFTIAATDDFWVIYQRGALYKYFPRERERRFLCWIPMSSKRRFLASFRLTDRLLRLTPRASILVDSNTLLFSISGIIYRVNLSSGLIEKELQLRKGMNNPLTFTRLSGIDGFDDCIVFGEYFSNNENECVNVWQRTGDGQWRIAYTFPPNTIYHIHSLVANKDRGEVLILTGDSNQESAIWIAKENFKEVCCAVGGSQLFRSCVAFPYKDGYVYATDTAREGNHIMYLYPDPNKGWQVDAKTDIPGPCIYGVSHRGKLYFSTSVEGDDTLSPNRYRFTYKLGAGVKDRYVHIIELDEDGNFKEISKWKKDCLPMLLFQFGNCLYPYSISKDFIVSPIAVKEYDGKTIIL